MPLVAEAWIRTAPIGSHSRYVYLPITLEGRRVSVLLDLGANGLTLSPSSLTRAGIRLGHVGQADSLIIGISREQNVPVDLRELITDAVTPPGLPPTVGLIGTDVLSHYDLVFDGPASRVRLYRPLSNPAGSVANRITIGDLHRPWLPPGLTQADCMPIRDNPMSGGDNTDRAVYLDVRVNDHPIKMSFFDSGSDVSSMNQAAATMLGLTVQNPHMRLIPTDSAGGYGAAGVGAANVYEMTDLRVAVGPRHLSETSVWIFPRLNPWMDDPMFLLGLDAIHDRILFVSYSSKQFCLSDAPGGRR